MKFVVFSREADAELTTAADDYDAKRLGLGRELHDEIAVVLRHVQSFPAIAPVLRGNIRRAVLHRFPFCLLYRETERVIEILSVAPTRADPAAVATALTKRM